MGPLNRTFVLMLLALPGLAPWHPHLHPEAFAQSIINTEAMFSTMNDSLHLGADVTGNLSLGSVELMQLGARSLFGYRHGRSLLRVVGGYDFLSKDGVVISSNLMGQIRYNHFLGERQRNSLFAFVQAQNVRSLNIRHRYLAGGGYRHRLYGKETFYTDLGMGGFAEEELYDVAAPAPATGDGAGGGAGSGGGAAAPDGSPSSYIKRQMRYSFTLFSRYPFTKRLYYQDAAYLQIAARDWSDHRLYYESSMNYRLQKATLSLRYRLRYFSTTYVSGNTPTDQSIVFGVQLSR